MTASFFSQIHGNGEELSNNLRKKNSLFYHQVSKAYYKDTKKKMCGIGDREGEGEKEVGERGRNGPVKQKCT